MTAADDERAARWAKGTVAEPVLEIRPEQLGMNWVLTVHAQAGLDRVDAVITDYHARRVPDAREAKWRTDYTRAYVRWDLAEDQPRRDHPDAVWLRARAAEIEQPWISDPQIARRWAELDALRVGAQYGLPWLSGETTSSMPGEAPPGMDPVTWRSQAQARDLTGHHRWPEVTTTSNREDTEPMNEPTQPDHGPETNETATEQDMRADFTRAWATYNNGWDYDPADEIEYSEYSERWLADERWMHEWGYLEDATLRWHDNLDPAQKTVEIDTTSLSPIRQRSEEQARDIAENGLGRNEYGGLTSRYVTRVEERNAAAAWGESPLADHQPGNALAAHSANCERDGIER